jgi:AraC-like DNA-binding protein
MVGHGFLELNGTRYFLEPNTIALVPANGSAIYGTVTNCNWEFQWIHYSGVHAEACTRDILRSGKTVIHLGSKESQQIASLFAQIAQNTCLGLEKRLMEAGIIDLILHTVLCQSALPKHTGQERTLVEMITEYVETAPTLSLDELSQQFHYSKEHLVRLYKAATGMTPYKYWLVSRLKRSCIALLDHSVTIERIAADLGFTSASNFYVQFKRHYGISPGEYRQLHCIPKP